MGLTLLCPCIAAESVIITPAEYEAGFFNDTNDTAEIFASGEMQVEALTPPVAAFSVSQSIGPSPLTVQFTDYSTGNPTQWGWYFGDGGTSNEQNPEHTYVSPGVYPVGFLVANKAGYNKTFVPGLIQTQNPDPTPTPVPTPVVYPPTAAFITSPPTGPVPLTVLFIDTSSDKPTSWAWYFGDGGFSPRRHPYHTFTRPGTYPVSLTVSNAGGSDTYIAENYIVATTPVPTPTPRPTIKPPCPIVMVQSVEESNTTLPVASFSADIKEESDLFMATFTDESSGNPQFRIWYFGDGSYSTDEQPVYTYPGPGTYQVSLMVVNDAGSSTVTGKVEVRKEDSDTETLENQTSQTLLGNDSLIQQSVEMEPQDEDAWSRFFEEWKASAGGQMTPLNIVPDVSAESENVEMNVSENMTWI